MFSIPISLWRHRRLLKDFVMRDLKARYVGSTMGFFWSVVFPILNLAVYVFVFRLVLNTRWSDSQGALEVALIMLSGIIVWTAFAETLSRATNSLVDNANLIKKVVFPSELLPPYLSGSSLINMTIGIPVLLSAVVFFGYVKAPRTLIVVPPEPVQPHVFEGDDVIRFPVHLTRGYARPITVPLEYSGSATFGVDYVAPTEVTIPAGHKGVWVHVVTVADQAQEGESFEVPTEVPGVVRNAGAETMTVRLAEGGRAGVASPEGMGRPSTTFWIVDSELTPPQELPELIAPVAISNDLPERRREDGSIEQMRIEYHPLALGASLICLPLFYAAQFLFMVGLGYLLATLNAFVRDVFHLVGVGTIVWMFGTPIFYPAHMVENAGFGWILAFNPMYWLIDCYRVVMVHGLWPDWMLFGKFAALAIVVFALGASFFRSQKSTFPDLL